MHDKILDLRELEQNKALHFYDNQTVVIVMCHGDALKPERRISSKPRDST